MAATTHGGLKSGDKEKNGLLTAVVSARLNPYERAAFPKPGQSSRSPPSNPNVFGQGEEVTVTRANVSSLALVLTCLVLSAADAEAQFASLSPTEEARLHACAVDVASGKPLEGVALRVLGKAEFKLFAPEDVKQLSDKLDVFSKFPVQVTNADGVVTMLSPLDLAITAFLGVSMGDRGFLIANPRSGWPLATRAEMFYSLAEVTSRQYSVNGKVHAGYLAPLGLVTVRDEGERKSLLRLNELSAEVTPLIVRKGDKFTVNVKWNYVAMPLMKSLVKVSGPDAQLSKPGSGNGLVQETWSYQLEPWQGRYTIEVKAYLDAPYKTLPAAVTKTYCYVADTELKEKAYRALLTAQKLSPAQNEKAITICQKIIAVFPDISDVWAELGKRLLASENWQELVNRWEKAPDIAKKTFGYVSACAVAYEKLGKKDKHWDMLLAVCEADDTPSAARAACFQDALAEKRYQFALRIVRRMEDDLPRRTWVNAERFLQWMSGDRSSTGKERIWVAEALWANGERAEALAALQSLDLNSFEASDREYYRAKYYETLAGISLDLNDLPAAEKSLAELAILKAKPLAEVASSDLLARLAEAKGDIDKAVKQYAKGYAGSESHVKVFSKALRRSLENPPQEPVATTCVAFSLLAAHNFTEALEVGQDAAKLAPDLPAAQLALGLALEMNAKIPEAVAALKKAAELAPQSTFVALEYKYAQELQGGPTKQATDDRPATTQPAGIAEPPADQSPPDQEPATAQEPPANQEPATAEEPRSDQQPKPKPSETEPTTPASGVDTQEPSAPLPIANESESNPPAGETASPGTPPAEQGATAANGGHIYQFAALTLVVVVVIGVIGLKLARAKNNAGLLG